MAAAAILFRAAALLLLLGYGVLWVMMPTAKFNTSWLPALQTTLNSTPYLGTQGVQLLMYPFPILCVAVLGCLHLHYRRTSSHSNLDRTYWAKRRLGWKRPMLVKGSLGILSGTELFFFAAFMVLLLWSLLVYLRRGLTAVTPQSAAMYHETVWQAKLWTSGLMVGFVGNVCLAALFFPVARGSSVLPLFGLTSEGSIKYHIWLGHTAMILFTVHGLCYVVLWTLQRRTSEFFSWAKAGASMVAGEISLAAGLLMWATTVPVIRRKAFEIFFYTHYLYIVFILFFILHVGISYAYTMLPGFYIFLIDRYLRLLQSRQKVRLLSARILPCHALELNFSKSPGWSYSPTSIMFLNVGFVSNLQWHPFSVISSSNLEPRTLSVIVKGSGSWSMMLYYMLSSPSLQLDRLNISAEGPYGPASTDFLRHDALVMVAGGSGIAPFVSIIRELIHCSSTTSHKRSTPEVVVLVCAFRNSTDLAMLDLILPISESPSLLSRLNIRIEAYVTRDEEPVNPEESKVRARWFKPRGSDVPISPILGPRSWLWLAAIVSSSFATFMVIIGMVTRYYIYPIENRKDDGTVVVVFPWSGRALLAMLALSLSITLTASAAVLLNKAEFGRKANKSSERREGSSMWVFGSPPWWEGSEEREMVTVPEQYLSETTNVYYGERPDLKRILFDCKEESVGVLVCGPREMRREVAAICSCGLVENLHFESISFSW